jgi:hypothetical protein
MHRAKLEAVSPEKGLSYSEANDDGEDETKLERPETSGGVNRLRHKTHRTTYMTVSMKRKLMLAMTSCIIPRGTSYATTNGGAMSSRGCGTLDDDGRMRPSGDVNAADVLSLSASTTWALHNQCIR